MTHDPRTPEGFRAARASLGLTAEQLAGVLGLSRPGSIYDYEAGREQSNSRRPSEPLARLLEAVLRDRTLLDTLDTSRACGARSEEDRL